MSFFAPSRKNVQRRAYCFHGVFLRIYFGKFKNVHIYCRFRYVFTKKKGYDDPLYAKTVLFTYHKGQF